MMIKFAQLPLEISVVINEFVQSDRKIVLLIGATGSGKSTLCNVLYNKVPQKIDQPFAVNDSTSSVTKIHSIKDNEELRIIDTIGLGDKTIETKDIVADISDAVETLKGGIHACLFVFKMGR